MYAHPDGLEFRYEGGLTADGVSDRASCELFGVAVRYAENAGDNRLSVTGNSQDAGLLEEHYRVCAQSLAGFVVMTVQFSGLPLSLRIEDACEYGGVCVRTEEIQVLGDMIEWLPSRVELHSLPSGSGKRLSRILPTVLQVLRLENSDAALQDNDHS